jgi:competence protein ComEC
MRHRTTEKGVKEKEFAATAPGLNGDVYRRSEQLHSSDSVFSGSWQPGRRSRVRFWIERFWFQLQDQWRHDCDFNSALLLWSAFLLALGAATYSYLPDEPVWWFLLLICVVCGGVAYHTARKGVSFAVPVLLFSFLLGLSVANLHGQFGGTSILTTPIYAKFIGRLEQVEYRAKDERWTIAVKSIKGLSVANTPRKLLLIRRSKGARFQAGDLVEAWARLIPLQRQAFPGSFDYGRYLWARQIGGQGYLGKRVKLITNTNGADISSGSMWHEAWAVIEQVRTNVAAYLVTHMEAEPAGLASALIVGKRDYLSPETKDALRLSGLAHILAISGLHMALVTLTIFGGVRLVCSFIEPLVLRYDIKKFAAWAALLAASCYLVLSGHGVATIRAYVMMVIFLGAILAGRPALTMHNVALALIIIVLSQPFSVVEPGLQMSFAATVALIAGYRYLEGVERWKVWAGRSPGQTGDRLPGLVGRGVALSMRWFAGLSMTALLAGVATMPFSIAFFHQMAPLGLVANLLAMPILSLLVMPVALISLLLVPFGLQQWPLGAMEWGLAQIILIAEWVLGISPQTALLAVGPAGLALAGALILASFAIHPNRLAIVVSVLVAVGLLTFNHLQTKPDIWIAENGRSMAARGGDERWIFAGIKESGFLAQALLKADGDLRALPAGANSNVSAISVDASLMKSRCDHDACRLTISGRQTDSGAEPDEQIWVVSLVKNMRAFAEECARSDVVISNLIAPMSCIQPRLIIDKARLQQHGSHFVWLPQDEARNGWLAHSDNQPHLTDSFRPNWLVWPYNDLNRMRINSSVAGAELKLKSAQPYASRPWQKSTISKSE